MMYRRNYRVTIKGEWERHNTTFEDLTHMREAVRYVEASPNDPHIRELRFVTRRGVFTDGQGRTVRRGTLEAVIDVRTKNGRVSVTRAHQELKNVVQDLACRSPRLYLDRERSSWERVY